MIVALIADVAVLLLILLYTAIRFRVTVVRKIYQLAERGRWGEERNDSLNYCRLRHVGRSLFSLDLKEETVNGA